MSQDDWTNCMKGEYNQDEEAVRFIIQIFELGGEEALKAIKENWEKIVAASGVIAALMKLGSESAIIKFIQSLINKAGAAFVEVLIAMIAGLGLAAVILAVTAAIECLPRLAN